MNSHFSYRGSALRTKERIRKMKYEIERCNPDKCNSDHNETFPCFHSERWKLRQKKRIDRSSILKLYEKDEKKGSIYVWYISHVYWIADTEMIESFLIGPNTNMVPKRDEMKEDRQEKKEEGLFRNRYLMNSKVPA